MKYTVIWKRAAEKLLAQIWLDTNDRTAVTQASHQIDQLLKLDPEDKGESRPNNRRILMVHPLAVIYKVEPLDRKVFVLKVWTY
jgi:hypothetical protein